MVDEPVDGGRIVDVFVKLKLTIRAPISALPQIGFF
jgi:hypothetical protein